MLRTLVQIQAPVYRKAKQLLSGFSIDKTDRVDLSNSVVVLTFYYTRSPPEGNLHFWAKHLEMQLREGSACEYLGASSRQVESAMQIRIVDRITRRELADLPVQNAWLCGFTTASLQRKRW